jgi:hypothetical protein
LSWPGGGEKWGWEGDERGAEGRKGEGEVRGEEGREEKRGKVKERKIKQGKIS